uniref:CCDC66 domain-containing protein n=1 Tax=Panagrolaimus superbus TaxID=310955 RepID=A0A914Y3M5_9BILA
MVRTYAFNPSTQSAGLPGNRKPPPEVLQQDPHLIQLPLNDSQSFPQQKVYEVFQQHPFDASLSSSSLSSGPLPPQIIPGSTQLFGIRSILIDGQHFYQPIDPQLNQLINKEFATLGIINNSNRNNNNSIKHDFNHPSDPGPSNQNYLSNNSVGLAAFHIANQPYLNASQTFAQSQISRSDSSKAFSEYDPAIQNNHVGIPVVRNQKTLHSAVNQQRDNDKNMIDDLPWARGNPQPKSGKRGSTNWNTGQQTSKVPSSLYSLNDPFTLSGKLVDSGHNSLHAAPPAASLYHFDRDAYTSLSTAPPLPVHLPSLNMSGSTNSYGGFYNDPLAASRNTYYPAQNPSKLSNSYQQEFPKNDKEQHKYELLRQIEENKRRKEYEKMRERELEDRERLRSEIFQARQQAEMDAEKRAVKEKALAVERKAARMAEMNSNYVNNKPSKSSNNRRPPSVTRENSRPTRQNSDDMSGPPRKLEWWEKKNTLNEQQRQQSPVIPALRNKNNPNQPPSRQINRAPSVESTMRNRTPSLDHSIRASTPQRRSSSQAPSRRSDSPRPASRPIRPMAQSLSRNSRHSIDSTDVRIPRFDQTNETLRSLDHTHRELEHEQRRVHKAIQENNYDHEVFR